MRNSSRSKVKPYVKLEGVHAQWTINEDRDTGDDIDNEGNIDHSNTGMQEIIIKDISFEFTNAEKVAIIGKVGSGKTSLLLTLLKELFIVKGKMKLNSSDLAYAE